MLGLHILLAVFGLLVAVANAQLQGCSTSIGFVKFNMSSLSVTEQVQLCTQLRSLPSDSVVTFEQRVKPWLAAQSAAVQKVGAVGMRALDARYKQLMAKWTASAGGLSSAGLRAAARRMLGIIRDRTATRAAIVSGVVQQLSSPDLTSAERAQLQAWLTTNVVADTNTVA